MATKTYGPADYKGTGGQSLTQILAGKGIVAKPGVASAGNKATTRAADFKAGKTYTPANSGRITQQQGPNRAAPATGPNAMRTSIGAGGRVGLSPARASGGFPNSAPPTSIGAPTQSRGGPAQNFIPPSFPGGGGAPSGGGLMDSLARAPGQLGSYLQQNGPTNFMGLGGGLSPQAPSPMSTDGWPTGDQNRWGQGGSFTPQAQAEPGRRWGGLGQAPRNETPTWLPSLFSLLAQMTGGK